MLGVVGLPTETASCRTSPSQLQPLVTAARFCRNGDTSQATLAPPDALRFALDAGIARLSRELEQYEHTPKGPARPMVGGRQATSQALTALTALRDVRPDAVLTAAHVAALGGPDEFVRRVVAGAAALEPGHVEHVTWRWGLQWLAQSLDQDLQPVTDKRQTRLAEWWGRMSSPQLGGA